MFDMTQTLSLYGNDHDRLKEIVTYILRGNEEQKLFTCYTGIVTIDRKSGENSTFVQIPVSTMLYYTLPKFFNVGRISIDISDPIALLNFFYDEYKRRIQSEEKSEEIPVNNIST
jgi:hypothetical protein